MYVCVCVCVCVCVYIYISDRALMRVGLRREGRLAVRGCHLHRSAYVSIRQHTSAYISIRQHTPAYISIRQHTSDLDEKGIWQCVSVTCDATRSATYADVC